MFSEEKAYIAAPFFNPAQVETVEKIKKLLDELKIPYFSPKDEAGNIEGIKSSKEERHAVFASNVHGMLGCTFAIAVIDDFDKGVIWEMGYLYANIISIIGYTDYPNRGLNIMLQESVCSFVHGIGELREKINEIFG